jgi:alkylated DNA repair dioxygenase AlkB
MPYTHYSLICGQRHQIPGLLYIPEFITIQEEAELESFTATQVHWDWLGKKRRLPFGFTYSPTKRKIVRPAPAVPAILHGLAIRLTVAGLMSEVANQIVFQEYLSGQGIGEHVDAPDFGPDIVSVSLLSPCFMRFRHKTQAGQRCHSRAS